MLTDPSSSPSPSLRFGCRLGWADLWTLSPCRTRWREGLVKAEYRSFTLTRS